MIILDVEKLCFNSTENGESALLRLKDGEVLMQGPKEPIDSVVMGLITNKKPALTSPIEI